MDVVSLIDELDALVQRSIRVPASGKLLVDDQVIRQIIAELRSAAPDEVRLGQRIAGERERILADARAQAQYMLEETQAHINARVDEQGIVQAARERARAIIADAENRAAQIQSQANQYTIGQLGALENRLQRLLREVQAGQRFLAQGGGPDEGAKTSRQS